MAGFGTTMSKLIEDDREYYRELATKKRDYLQTYGTKAILDRDEKANGAVSLFNTLVTAGIPQDDLRYVLDTTGVSGLAELKSTLSTRDDLTPAQIKGLVEKSKDYVAENPNEDITEVMRRAYGLYKSSDNPVEQETNMFAAVLGLDSRMMERDVLNDVYIDGFKGYELETIMARGGPKPGEALSLNLPTKPPSPQLLASAAKTLQGQFDASIDAKIKAATRNNNPALVETLENLKGRGVDAIYEYATAEGYGDPSLLDFANRMEAEKPGLVSRNTINLGNFTSQFNSWVGDQEDDNKLDSAPNGGETPPGSTPRALTPSELRVSLSNGELTAGTKVVVNGKEVVITQEQVNKSKVEFPLEEDNRSRLLSETSFSKDVTTALKKGKSINTWVTSINPEPALTAAGEMLDDAVANVIDFVAGVFGADEVPAISEELRKGPPPKKVIAAMQDKTFEDIYNRFSIASDTPMPTEAEEELRNAVDAEVLKRVEEAHRAKVLKQQAMNEGVRVLPESPGDVPDNLENSTTESISKALRFLTEIPEKSHQFLFDTQGKINASIAALFEETLEERIMKNEGQRNRVVALQALKDKISDLRKEAEVEQTVEPEPLVTRPKKPLKPKGMTASDKARLQRAQKANELSGDSGLLEMLVEKYGIALVQKEMGL